jgi:hypothetical protein
VIKFAPQKKREPRIHLWENAVDVEERLTGPVPGLRPKNARLDPLSSCPSSTSS